MIDINKKYRTRDGREVRIYATDGHEYPIHGAVMDRGWCVHYWDADGRGQLQRFDLIEIKLRIYKRVWINVYPDRCLGTYREKKHADRYAAPDRIGCVQVEIDIEEGHGL